MNDNQTHSISPDFWRQLSEIRSISRRVLVALEEDDIEKVERLSRESDRLMAEVRPFIEGRSQALERNDDDLLMKELLGELGRMNQRILDVIAERREEVRQELGQIRDCKLKLVHYRSAGEKEPELLDVSR